MTLREELQARFDCAQRQASAIDRETMRQNAEDLVVSGLTRDALGVGAHAPGFVLPSATGDDVSLAALLTDGPVVLTFYRGAWCPYCNLALRALQLENQAIRKRGARLVAVSPQIPDESFSLIDRHDLAFDVLSDIGSEAAKQYGIAFDLSEELAALYDRRGIDLQRINGGYARTLPLPATYVIDSRGIVRWAFVSSDHTLRAEPANILAALDALD
jgi:peroxiredoxin